MADRVKAEMAVERPDELVMTLKLSMPIGDWARLEQQLDSSFPAWKLTDAIRTMLAAARRIYHAPQIDCFDATTKDLIDGQP